MTPSDRRSFRTDDPTQAIRYYLARNATEPGLRAAVVSCMDGLMVGGVGEGPLEALAAIGTCQTEGRPSVVRDCKDYGFDPDQLHTRVVDSSAGCFVVTSLGAPLGAADGVGSLLGRMLA